MIKEEITPLLNVARGKGCRSARGTKMRFEMIPAYRECAGFGTCTPSSCALPD